MLSDELRQVISKPVSPYMQQTAVGITWLKADLLTPIQLGEDRLTPDQMRSLVSAMFEAPVQTNSHLGTVRRSVSGEALDLLASEVINQAAARVRRNQQGHHIGFPPFLYPIAGLIGSHRTAQALRTALSELGEQTIEAVKALLTIEKAKAIGFCAEMFRRGSFMYWGSFVEQAIDEMCAECGVSDEERKLRSLPGDPAKKKEAQKALQALFTGGFAWDEQTFRGTILDHPLLLGLAQGLVWGELAKDGSARNLFRLTESKSLIDLLGESANPGFPVVIVHPAQVDPSEIEQWKTLWRREKLASPFPQWDADHIRCDQLKLPEKSVSPSELLTGLESRGWKRGRIEKGVLREHWKEFPHLKSTAYVRYTGIPVTYGGEWGPQHVESVYFLRSDAPLPVVDANPVALSTVYADLDAVAGEG